MLAVPAQGAVRLAWRDASRRSAWCASTASLGLLRHVTTVVSPPDIPLAARKKTAYDRARKTPWFADQLEISVEGGAGGDGCIAFARDKLSAYGPPSGGGGGQGASIYVQAQEGIASLARLPSIIQGVRGENGVGDWQTGRPGQDRVLKVPIGTIVRVEHVPFAEGSAEAKQAAYHDRLIQKYRNTYLRERPSQRRYLPPSLKRANFSLGQEEDDAVDPLELRAERDASWRHYPGLMSSSENEELQQEEEEEYMEDEVGQESEEKEGVMPYEHKKREPEYTYKEEEEMGFDPELDEAESDILTLGRSFRSSEKRFAFWLIDERRRMMRKQMDARQHWGLQERFDDGEHANDMADLQAQGWTVDLDKASDTPLLVCKGGAGGLGNAYFASARTRSPTSATRGTAGQHIVLHLEWKFKGDVGLIGMPNAGKSTFLKASCAAGDSVRVAGYAFTTLKPNVGTVRIGERGTLLGTGFDDVVESTPALRVVDGSRAEDDDALAIARAEALRRARRRELEVIPEDEIFRFTLQDLPGLVEGAASNRGLGHDFLKHVERCTALYYVLDVSNSSSSDDAEQTPGEPWVDLELVHSELESYRANLSDKVRGVLANKCDLLLETAEGQAVLERLRSEAKRLHGGRDVPVYAISARKRLGVQEVIHAMADVVDQAREEEKRRAA